LYNPLYWHLIEALRNPSIRYIHIEGGSSAGKTYTISQALLNDTYEHEYGVMTFRRYHVDILDSVYKSFKVAAKALQFDDYYYFQQDFVKSQDDKGFVRFRGLDDEEDVKGIEGIGVIYMNEWNQFTEKQYDQIKKRLRGSKNQKIITDWNPVSGELWFYNNLLDIQEWAEMPLHTDRPYSQLDAEHSFKRINKAGDTLWIKTTYRDNYWVVGHPSGKGGFHDVHTLAAFEFDRLNKPNMYRIYANGERGVQRTGGEFWKQFNENAHVSYDCPYIDGHTLHISCDQNTIPYITLTVWQPIGNNIRQIKEILCTSPDNNAPRSADMLIRWLRAIGYEDVVFLYGDPSGNNRSTIDYNSSSYYDKFIDVLEDNGYPINNRVARAHPEVALSAAFVNDIYEHELYGYKITISGECKTSIYDYTAVQEHKDGAMLKTKVKDKESGATYEPIGHISDTKRYFITKYLESEFKQYKVRGRKNGIIAIDY
jgi:hypothetical protein